MMKGSINRRLAKLEAAVGSVDLSRPTVTDIWLYQLEDVVARIVKHFRHVTEPRLYGSATYDHFFLYAHRDRLRTVADVRAASDDVLLEALGLPNVAQWGWMRFMVRELPSVSMLAHNWGLPSARLSLHSPLGVLSFDERMAQAALYFTDLMCERGYDARERMLDYFTRDVAEASVLSGRSADDVCEACLEAIRRADEFAYYVLICDLITFGPRALRPPGPVLYDRDLRSRFLSEIRAAAANRRRLWRESREAGQTKELTPAAADVE